MARYRGSHPGDWTEAELVFLAEGPELGLTIPQVAEKLGRTAMAVRSQASKLRIRYPRQGAGKDLRLWSPEEDEFIREMAPSFSYQEIAACLERSEAAVGHRAFRLGVAGRSRSERALRGADHPWSQNPVHGPDHPAYRGGTSGLVAYRGEDWAEFRLLALERDACTCQDCGLFVPSGKGLVIHHVIPWRLRPVNELRWLVTLCGPDHLRRPEHRWVTIPEDVEAQLRDAA